MERPSDRLIEYGEQRQRETTRMRSLEVLNDLLNRMDRNGALSCDIEELESSLKAFKRAEILQDFEVRSWTAIIERLRAESREEDEDSGPQPNGAAEDDDEDPPYDEAVDA